MFSFKLIGLITLSAFASSPDPYFSEDRIGPASKGHGRTVHPGDEVFFPWFESFRTRFLSDPLMSDHKFIFHKLVKRVECCPIYKSPIAAVYLPFGVFDFYSDKNTIESWKVPPVTKGYPIGEYEFLFNFYGHEANPNGEPDLIFQESFTIYITALELFVRLEDTFFEFDSTFKLQFAIYNNSSSKYQNIYVVLLKRSNQNPLIHNESGELVHYGIYRIVGIEPFSRLEIEDFVISRGDKSGMIDFNERQGYYYLMAFTTMNVPSNMVSLDFTAKFGVPLAYSSPFPIKSMTSNSKSLANFDDSHLFIAPNINTIQHYSHPIFLIKKHGARNVFIHTFGHVVERRETGGLRFNEFFLSIAPNMGGISYSLSKNYKNNTPKTIAPGRRSITINLEGSRDTNSSIKDSLQTNFISSTVLQPTTNSTFFYDEEIPVAFYQSFCIHDHNSAFPSYLFLSNLRIELAIPSAIFMPQEGDFIGPHYRVLERIACFDDPNLLFTFLPKFMTLDDFKRLARLPSGSFEMTSTVELSVAIKRGAIPIELEGQFFILRIRADCYEFGIDASPISNGTQTDNSGNQSREKGQFKFHLVRKERNVVLAETPEFAIINPGATPLFPRFFRFPRYKGRRSPIIPYPFFSPQATAEQRSIDGQKLDQKTQNSPPISEPIEEGKGGKRRILMVESDPSSEEDRVKHRKPAKITPKDLSKFTMTNYLPVPSRPVLITERCSSNNGICAQLHVEPRFPLPEPKDVHARVSKAVNSAYGNEYQKAKPVRPFPFAQKVLHY